MEPTKILLEEKEMPTSWYNVLPDLPRPLDPLLSPTTKQPATPEEIGAIFPMSLIMQEVSQDSTVEIPPEVQEVYRMYRPSPLIRAKNLEKRLDTPARIFCKYEGVSPAGSHKLNTAIAQAYFNKEAGITKISTETGAGQWGSALALACRLLGMELTVYMVKASYNQKPYRRVMMETWGADVVPSPSSQTKAGQAILSEDADSPGSLGIAISEAVEHAATREDTNYSLGSVLNHVLLHQTIIGQEARKQLEKVDAYPDVIVGCVGGGSSFGGIALPFVKDKVQGTNIRLLAVEPAACPTLTKGKYTYDYGDTVGIGPIAKMYTLGHTFVPEPIHAGGLRYHGDSPILCSLYDQNILDATAYHQNEVFEAAVTFAQTEGIIVAPETAHGVKGAVDEALAAKESGERRTILLNLTGHGHFDLGAYDDYHAGKLEDYEYPEAKIEEALSHLPDV